MNQFNYDLVLFSITGGLSTSPEIVPEGFESHENETGKFIFYHKHFNFVNWHIGRKKSIPVLSIERI